VPDPLLSTEAVARLLDLSPGKVRRLVRRGELEAVVFGGPGRPEYKFEPAAVDAMIASKRSRAGPPARRGRPRGQRGPRKLPMDVIEYH
jgi:excisionase family DNA binding protein